MVPLTELIQSLTKEEVRYYKLLAQRTHSGGERKDLMLFDAIRKENSSFSEEKFLKRAYPNQDKNTYYRLRNRLAEDVFKSQLILHFKDKESVQSANYLTLAQIYFSKNEFQIAHFLLKKAEKKAVENEEFELLDLVYSLYIRLSVEMININPEEYIRKRQHNYEMLKHFREIDDILATVNYNLKISQNYDEPEAENVELTRQVIEKLSELPDAAKSSKFRLKIYHAISKLLLQTKDYLTLSKFSIVTYEQFEEEGKFNRNNHEDKLTILTFIVNSLFKQSRYQESLKYSQILGNEIQNYGKLLYDKYALFYYNSLVINYSELDIDKAISILEDLKGNDALKHSAFYEVIIHLNLSIFYFKKNLHGQAIRELVKLYGHDKYKSASVAFRHSIGMTELIIRFDMEDVEVWERRYRQIKKEFQAQIKADEKDKAFIALLGKLNKYRVVQTTKARALIDEFLTRFEGDPGESEVINYENWLRSIKEKL